MKVIVVGGGAAGMMAAFSCAVNGHETILIEKNNKLGKKLFLTGKGRCNLTNACDMEELFHNIVSNEKFLYSALYDLDNVRTVELFNSFGLKTKIERGNRVFPVSDHSSDVIKALSSALMESGVEILYEKEVTDLITEDIVIPNQTANESPAIPVMNDTAKHKGSKKKHSGGFVKKIKGVVLSDGSRLFSDAVIFATGGKSYGSTGSDGKAFELFDPLGIERTDLKPALVPFNVKEGFVPEMSGLSLKNVTLTIVCEGRTVYSGFGEMLFTHFGISGPLVLSASSYLNKGYYGKEAEAYIDMKPALDRDKLDDRLLRDFADSQNKHLKNVLTKLLPQTIITSVIKLSAIDPDKPVNNVTRAERENLINTIKNYPLTIASTRGFDEAIITSGGIKTKEINPSTMESKKIKNLYFCGEMIDVDALTGGFNLQIAWSTGHLAGMLGGSNE